MAKRLRLSQVGMLLVTGVGSLIGICLLVLGSLVTLEAFEVTEFFAWEHETDPGVAIATTGLALFTGLLFLFGAVTAIYAYEEIRTSAAANKANLALDIDNRFHSDRALRIRHGAVAFLANHQRDENGDLRRNLDLHCDDLDKISPYATDETNRWNDLPSDLIDIFNYYDWIGYLVEEQTETIDLEVVQQKFGPWIINYYQICEKELDQLRTDNPTRWRYLETLYGKLLDNEEKVWKKNSNSKTPPYHMKREDHELDAFLLREHVRAHRRASLEEQSE